jgi:hypothetical protein
LIQTLTIRDVRSKTRTGRERVRGGRGREKKKDEVEVDVRSTRDAEGGVSRRSRRDCLTGPIREHEKGRGRGREARLTDK